MSYQGQTWVDEVALPHLLNGGELLVMLRVANHAGNGYRKMSGCRVSAKTLAKECLMGRSTVLNHLRNLAKRGLLIPGDPALVQHLPPDKRPPVYDLAGGHEPGCIGGHTDLDDCTAVAGAGFEHSPKNPRSAGAQSQHSQPRKAGAGAQIRSERVLKSSTKSSKDLKDSSLSAEAGEQQQESAAPEAAEEREKKASPTTDTAPAEPTDDTTQVLAAYEQALGGPALNGTRKQLLTDAAELLAARPLWWVIARAQELPKYGTSLAKHAAMSKAPFATKTPAPRQSYTSRPTEPERGPVSTKSITSLLDALQSPSI